MLLLNTSGTIRKCKIVQLCEQNISASVLGYIDKMCFNETTCEEARFILAVPFSCAYGIMILCACLNWTYPVIVLNHPFTLDAFFKLAQKHSATHYEGSTTAVLLMKQMADKPVPYNISKLKFFGFGGSAVSGEIIETVQRAYPGIGFYQGYGMTEAAPLIAKHPLNIPMRKAASVGSAIKGIKILIETDNGITHAPNVIGEIIVKGENIMQGYYNNNEETARIIKNNYLYTGDVGYLDNEGYLYICGRNKNIIIVRGFNVYPEEIESCILSSGLAKDCFVYGAKDLFSNEIVCADVVPLNLQVTAEQLRIYINSHLTQYKRPQVINFCETVEKNPAGKIKRNK